MGEAKSRRLSDPTFGRVPKEHFRGLVVCSPVVVNGRRLHVGRGGLDPQEVRFGLFLWDQLAWPSSRVVYFESGPDEAYLIEAGLLTRPEYTFPGDVAAGIARTQLQAYQDLESARPGAWSLAQGERSLLLLDDSGVEGNGTAIELHRAIPLPAEDVPLAEILEFRQRRRDELLLLRHSLESLAARVEASADNERELQRCFAELDQACADLLKVGHEWRFPVYLANVKATLNLSPVKFLPAVAAGWKLAEGYGLVAASAVAGVFGAASTLEIKGDYGLRSIRRLSSPYCYAYHVHHEFGRL